MEQYRYGGHYGPAFAAYFLQQNAAIEAGTLQGTIINLKNLGIGNGLTVCSYYMRASMIVYSLENVY